MFSVMLRGEAGEVEIAAALAAMQSRRPTVDELEGAARVMREHVERVPVDPGVLDSVIDTCGTGGAPKTFNVSTAAAIIAAASQGAKPIRVAKHGNRSRTGRGSAEVLGALGVNLDATVIQQARCLEDAGVCFCFAIRHHPAMRFVGPVRTQISAPTVFNLLGPLTNPAGASRQLIGVYDSLMVESMARVLERLGAVRAIVARGDDGLDEMTTTTTSTVWSVDRGIVTDGRVDPSAYGLARASMESLRATDLDDAAGIIRSVLAGEAGPRLDIALLNAAGALVVAEAAADLGEGVEIARDAVGSGRAVAVLDRLVRVSHSG